MDNTGSTSNKTPSAAAIEAAEKLCCGHFTGYEARMRARRHNRKVIQAYGDAVLKEYIGFGPEDPESRPAHPDYPKLKPEHEKHLHGFESRPAQEASSAAIATVSKEFSDLVCIGEYTFYVEEEPQTVVDAINKACQAAIETARALPDERWLAQQLAAANKVIALLQSELTEAIAEGRLRQERIDTEAEPVSGVAGENNKQNNG